MPDQISRNQKVDMTIKWFVVKFNPKYQSNFKKEMFPGSTLVKGIFESGDKNSVNLNSPKPRASQWHFIPMPLMFTELTMSILSKFSRKYENVRDPEKDHLI